MSDDHWEDLDASGTFLGVFACEGYSPDPVALFSREGDVQEWMAWQGSRGDENTLGGCDYTVCIVERLTGRVWNSHDEPRTDAHAEGTDIRIADLERETTRLSSALAAAEKERDKTKEDRDYMVELRKRDVTLIGKLECEHDLLAANVASLTEDLAKWKGIAETLRNERDAREACWSCPGCAFTFAAYHTNADGSMTCVLCERDTARAEGDKMRKELDAWQRAAQRIVDAHDPMKHRNVADWPSLEAVVQGMGAANRTMRPVFQAAKRWRETAYPGKRSWLAGSVDGALVSAIDTALAQDEREGKGE